MHRVCKLTVGVLACAGLAGLAGCATRAELDSLRSDVAKANATAVRAANEASRARRELADLKAAGEQPEPYSGLMQPPGVPLGKARGYKWGCPCMPPLE